MVAVDVHDPNYRESLSYSHIFIECAECSVLASTSNELWSHAVAIPISPEFVDAPSTLLLPIPKPDFVFGFSQRAFASSQIASMLHLVEGVSGHDYPMPDKEVRIPFLVIEVKSQRQKGTHYWHLQSSRTPPSTENLLDSPPSMTKNHNYSPSFSTPEACASIPSVSFSASAHCFLPVPACG
ncbi:hypothetical protein VC83_04777 [Pseudogymnoascus destructans]|uniref:DUF7924 domain-containing protein n=1 Tax=Pseudogymnoascus destructans TaxID=655981 RepID=A0A177A8C0_9PEZI|nr:uncharacterized protein VC83_04777 [Pseudogymnoascus destructans]OAF57373.1 hypothetical protein VC83_04777 [Pseudogymnoascus destructans]